MKNFTKFILHKDNLIHNVLEIKRLKHNKKICAMVKANAYGHGLIEVAKIINRYVDYFGVASTTEAIKLREAGFTKPILICGMTSEQNYEECVKNNISISINNINELYFLKKLCKRIGKKAYVHIAINSGMNRLGVANMNTFKKMLKFFESTNLVVFQGLYTHFGGADLESAEYFENQKERFKRFVEHIEDRNSVIVHASASSGALRNDENDFDMLRIGLLLYGYAPEIFKEKIVLKPVLEIKSKIVKVTSVSKGDFVGYGSFKRNNKGNIGLIPFGYYDGYNRLFRNGGRVIINDKYYNVYGNICMDMFFVDLGEDKIKPFTDCILLGESEHCIIDARELGRCANTIEYEVLTKLNRERVDFIVK